MTANKTFTKFSVENNGGSRPSKRKRAATPTNTRWKA